MEQTVPADQAERAMRPGIDVAGAALSADRLDRVSGGSFDTFVDLESSGDPVVRQ